MTGETIITLVKVLERLKRSRFKYNYIAAWVEFVISVIWLTDLYIYPLITHIEPKLIWVSALTFIIALTLLLQSLYLIIQHKTNQKFAIIIEALLENKNMTDHLVSEIKE